MNIKRRHSRKRILRCVGLILITGSVLLTTYHIINRHTVNQNRLQVVEQIDSVLPEPSADIALSGGSMPAMEIEGTDYVGLIKIPSMSIKLPVVKEWDDKGVRECPCRYSGSVYSGNLVIGGSNAKNQFDFLTQLKQNVEISFADMKGNNYVYYVSEIRHFNDWNEKVLQSVQKDMMVLFSYDSDSSKYVMVLLDSTKR